MKSVSHESATSVYAYKPWQGSAPDPVQLLAPRRPSWSHLPNSFCAEYFRPQISRSHGVQLSSSLIVFFLKLEIFWLAFRNQRNCYTNEKIEHRGIVVV